MAQALPSSFEVRGGVLAHDVPDCGRASRSRAAFDIKGELLLGRGLVARHSAAGGGSIHEHKELQTGRGYVDARPEGIASFKIKLSRSGAYAPSNRNRGPKLALTKPAR
jgi:hypothetical protein